MHYSCPFALLLAFFTGSFVGCAENARKDWPTKVEAKNHLVPIIFYCERENKKKEEIGRNCFLRDNTISLSRIYVDLKRALESEGHEMEQERFHILKSDNSSFELEPNHTATIGSLARHEPYTLSFIFKDPRGHNEASSH